MTLYQNFRHFFSFATLVLFIIVALNEQRIDTISSHKNYLEHVFVPKDSLLVDGQVTKLLSEILKRTFEKSDMTFMWSISAQKYSHQKTDLKPGLKDPSESSNKKEGSPLIISTSRQKLPHYVQTELLRKLLPSDVTHSIELKVMYRDKRTHVHGKLILSIRRSEGPTWLWSSNFDAVDFRRSSTYQPMGEHLVYVTLASFFFYLCIIACFELYCADFRRLLKDKNLSNMLTNSVIRQFLINLIIFFAFIAYILKAHNFDSYKEEFSRNVLPVIFRKNPNDYLSDINMDLLFQMQYEIQCHLLGVIIFYYLNQRQPAIVTNLLSKSLRKKLTSLASCLFLGIALSVALYSVYGSVIFSNTPGHIISFFVEITLLTVAIVVLGPFFLSFSKTNLSKN